MKFLFTIILTLLVTDPKEIAKVNAIKEQAQEAFLSGNYEEALTSYSLLRDSMGVADPAIDLNMGHAYYHLGDTANAKTSYGSLTSSSNKKLTSIAYQQLGVMNKDLGKLDVALQQLKSAIKTDPSNQEARYNYEVVKKLLEEQEQQQQNQDQNQDGEDQEDKQDQENQENQDQQNQEGDQENQEQQQEGEQENQEEKQEGEDQEKSEEEKEQEQKEQQQKEGEEEQEEEEKSQEEMTKEKLEELGITEEKARQLLEAMRQSEIKYLQHQRRKPTKRPPSGKPDW